MSILNDICIELGLFEGARPTPVEDLVRKEIIPTIRALKQNNPEAAILIEENQRVHRLWRDALGRLIEERRRADGFLRRYEECERDRQSLLQVQARQRTQDAQLADTLRGTADYFDEPGEPSEESLENLPALLRRAAARICGDGK